jgi:signal transduction histidine kinase
VQEALTSVVRDAGTARCRVAIDYRDGELAVEVVDDGRGAKGRTMGGGFGITGMGERVVLLDGDFRSGGRALAAVSGWRPRCR